MEQMQVPNKHWPFHFRINGGRSVRFPAVASTILVHGVPVGDVHVTCHGGDESDRKHQDLHLLASEDGFYHLELTVEHGLQALVRHQAPASELSLEADHHGKEARAVGEVGASHYAHLSEEYPPVRIDYARLILHKDPPKEPVATIILVRNSDWYTTAAHYVTINQSRTIHLRQWFPVAVENVPVGEVYLRCPQVDPSHWPQPHKEIHFEVKPGQVYYIETITTPGILAHHVSCVYRSAAWFLESGHDKVSITGHVNEVTSIDYREYEEWNTVSL